MNNNINYIIEEYNTKILEYLDIIRNKFNLTQNNNLTVTKISNIEDNKYEVTILINSNNDKDSQLSKFMI